MSDFYNNADIKTNSALHFFVRFVVASLVLAITAFFTPGFSIGGFFPLLLSALVIAILDFAVSKVGVDASPFGRGLTGFALSAAIIYFTQFFVAGYNVTIMGALIGAIIYGLVDAFIPGKAM